jgi:hypothetical protein
VHQHRPQENGQVVTMMRTTASTQPLIIIVASCITLHRSAYDTAGNIRSIFMYIGRRYGRFFLKPAKMT